MTITGQIDLTGERKGRYMKSDREASNAIVQIVSFYAGALGRASVEIETHEKAEAGLNDALDKACVSLTNYETEINTRRIECERLQIENQELKSQLKDERTAIAAERRRCNDLAREKSEVESKLAKLLTENERLQRVNIESHNERDKGVKAVREAGEAMGWLKSEASHFVNKLREYIVDAEMIVESPTDVLHAVARLVAHWKATGGDEAFKTHKPNPKRATIPTLGPGGIVELKSSK